MQNINWNDLRYLLAIKRGLTLAAAARQIGVDDTTVSRRLAALQSAMGTPLLQRQGEGKLMLTPEGEAVVHHAEVMEHQFDLIGDALHSDRGSLSGSVRLTSVPILVNHLLVPKVGPLLKKHPELQLELIPESRDLSLTRREADLAIRLARPKTGGTNVKARRIGQLSYSVYASRGIPANDAACLPWISYDDTMTHLPQAQWMARAAKGRAGAISTLKVHDVETALEAVLAGLGKSLLPSEIAKRDRRLRSLQIDVRQPTVSREMWLLAHADQLELGRIKAVIVWIEETVMDADWI